MIKYDKKSEGQLIGEKNNLQMLLPFLLTNELVFIGYIKKYNNIQEYLLPNMWILNQESIYL